MRLESVTLKNCWFTTTAINNEPLNYYIYIVINKQQDLVSYNKLDFKVGDP